MTKCDLMIIGAGPAGMAAAAQAAKIGLSVTLLDEQPRPGGQIYRDVDKVAAIRGPILGEDYLYGTSLTSELRHKAIDYIAGAVVWCIEDGFKVSYVKEGCSEQIEASHILLATGALERSMPLPGWTLPGVMMAGAGQILLKQSGLLAKRAVLIGSGPLLYLIAVQMIRAGTPPLALVETQRRADFMRATSEMGGALRGWRYLLKGLKMLGEINRAGIARYPGAKTIAIEGNQKAEAVSFICGKKNHHILCDTVFLHHGVVPNTQAARALGVSHFWDNTQLCFVPDLDEWGESNLEGIFIAGDSAGIGGAKSAELSGRLTALRLTEMLGKISISQRDRMAVPLHRAKAQELAVRPFLNKAYPPLAESLSPAGDTIICRCEEVSAGDIRGYAKLGCLGPNQTKAFGRVGMGPCQGRYCGLNVTLLLARENGTTPEHTGYYRIRPPLKPVTLAELATMKPDTSISTEQENNHDRTHGYQSAYE